MAAFADLPHLHSSFPLAIENVHPRSCSCGFLLGLPRPESPAIRCLPRILASESLHPDPSRDSDQRWSGSLSDVASQSAMVGSISAGAPRSQSQPDLALHFSAMPVSESRPGGESDALKEDRRVKELVIQPKATESYAVCGDDTLSMIDKRSLSMWVAGILAQVGGEEALTSLQRIFLYEELWITKFFSELFGRTVDAHDFLMQKLELLFTFIAQMVALGLWRPWDDSQVAVCSTGCSCTLQPPFSAPTFLKSTSFDTAPTGNRWADKARIRRMMEERGIKKEPGMSRIEINGKLHSFVANDRSHPQIKEIHKEIDRIHKEMREAGYDPDTRFVLHDLPEAEKQKAIQYHSERLAMCLGFISTPPRTSLRIVKNLRVCGDCHVATKYMSKLTQREIIMRDAFRFHHFRNGVCSCGDYW